MATTRKRNTLPKATAAAKASLQAMKNPPAKATARKAPAKATVKDAATMTKAECLAELAQVPELNQDGHLRKATVSRLRDMVVDLRDRDLLDPTPEAPVK